VRRRIRGHCGIARHAAMVGEPSSLAPPVISPLPERQSALDRAKIAYADTRHRLQWQRAPVARITRRFVSRHGLSVREGPFAGMRFPRFAVGRGEVVVPQLLGAYELELRAAIESVVADCPATIVDIGASDGYYAVGLARACPASTVYAYEMNFFPARVCHRLAAENGVADRIVMRGECRVADLQGLAPGDSAFVLSDCEGAERELMDPDAVPWLRDCRLIVELHDFAAPGIEETILSRFESSHDIEVIRSRRRYVAEWPALLEVPKVGYMDQEVGVNEFRLLPIAWAVMNPRG
jgi:predicted O-methyltransferase YrrM